MNVAKTGLVALTVAGLVTLAPAVAAPAWADAIDNVGIAVDDPQDAGDTQDPQAPDDPTNPDYWDSGEHAGGTGEEAQDNGPSYNNQDEPTGGTGEDPGVPDFSIDHGSEAAGAF